MILFVYRTSSKTRGRQILYMENISFRDQFPQISQKQFDLASSIATKVYNIIDNKAQIAHDNHVPKSFFDPNFIWEIIQLFAYCYKNPSYDVINTWRLHNYTFTGNHLLPFIGAAHYILPTSISKRYLKETRGLPDEFIAKPPRICGECGWEINGGIVNNDTLMYQRHLRTLYFTGVIEHLKELPNPKILEIGGGYGGLAYFIKKLLPNARYYMIDLPESLAFPAVYLQIARPEDVSIESVYDGSDKKLLNPNGHHFTFVPNMLLSHLDNITSFDLVINTGSFGEMNRDQVRTYAEFIHKNMAERGLLYEENHDVIYDNLDYDKNPHALVQLSDILTSSHLYSKQLDGRKKIWAKNKNSINQLAAHIKHIDTSQPPTIRYKRKMLDQASRIIQRLPRTKRLIKKILGRKEGSIYR